MNLQRTVHEWNDDDKNWWSRRSGLEQKLIILLVIIGVSSIGIFIYFAITRTAETAETCNTPRCLLAASRIIAHVDTSIDPCDDFFKFACGKLIEYTHGDAEAISKLSVYNLIERQLKEIIEEPINDDDHYLVKSQRQLFQACLNETAVEEDSLDIFKQTIKELKGWPVVVGYHWKARQFDWQDMIYELRERGYIHSMMLSVDVEYDFIHRSNYIVAISEPTVKSIDDEQKDLYKKYMVDVAVAFGADRHLASIEMEQVFDFKDKLDEIVAESLSLRFNNSNESKYNWTADQLSRTFTIGEFENEHNEMDWFEFINTIISPLANISSDDYVVFPNPEFINKFFYLLYRTSKRTQANYIIWEVLQNIMPFMPKELKQIEADYTCLTVQQASTPDRSEFCKEVVNYSFLPGITDIIYARRYLSEEKKAQVEELFSNIQLQLSTSIRETTWMDEESKESSSAKADAITGIIGFEEEYFNDTIFEKFVIPNDSLEDFGHDSFFHMLLKSRKRQIDGYYYLISTAANTSDMYLTTTQFNFAYSTKWNTLQLSPNILQGVYYNEDNPQYLNYGAIGSEIGQYLINLLTGGTMKPFDAQMQCFTENIENFDVEYNNSEIDTTITVQQIAIDYAGVQLAYTAYKNWVDEHTEEPQLPGIEYNPNQLFWISAMLPQCYKFTEEVSNSVLVAGPMVNNADFADDFSCAADSRMNPSEKCQFF